MEKLFQKPASGQTLVSLALDDKQLPCRGPERHAGHDVNEGDGTGVFRAFNASHPAPHVTPSAKR